MKRNLLLLFLILFAFNLLSAQSKSLVEFQTPGNGTIYNLNTLSEISDGVLEYVDGEYMLQGIIVVKGTDELHITNDAIMKCAAETRINIEHKLIVSPPNKFLMTALDTVNADSCFIGLYLKDNVVGSTIVNTTIEYGCGLKIVDCDTVKVCKSIFYKNKYDNSQGMGAINVSGSNLIVDDCVFESNNRCGISSPSNGYCSVVIKNSLFIKNNEKNGNYPQINMGPGDYNIEDNYIEGFYDRAGGIAISTLMGGEAYAIISRNEVRNNRYGIAGVGNNINMVITENIVIDNNLEVNPMNGGSGLNLYATEATSYMLASQNIIKGNLWGITIQGQALCNIGNVSSSCGGPNIGMNVIMENANNGIEYNLYNNTPNKVLAQHNYWGYNSLEESLETIVGFDNDPNLGEIVVDPIFIYTECNPPRNLAANVLDNNTVELTWAEPIYTPADSFYVYRNNDLLLVTENLNFTDTNLEAGEYEYSVIAKYTSQPYHDCELSDAISITVELTNAIKDADISVYPNPTDGIVYVDGIVVENIVVYNSIGQTIGEYKSSQLNLTEYPTGLYFIKLITINGSAKMYKILKK